MPEAMPDRMSEAMPDRMPKAMPDRMPKAMSDGRPEAMPDRMPEAMPERMSKSMPDRHVSDLHVMVGITRSKVISRFFFRRQMLFLPLQPSANLELQTSRPCVHFLASLLPPPFPMIVNSIWDV